MMSALPEHNRLRSIQEHAPFADGIDGAGKHQRFNVAVADNAFRWTDPRRNGPRG